MRTWCKGWRNGARRQTVENISLHWPAGMDASDQHQNKNITRTIRSRGALSHRRVRVPVKVVIGGMFMGPKPDPRRIWWVRQDNRQSGRSIRGGRYFQATPAQELSDIPPQAWTRTTLNISIFVHQTKPQSNKEGEAKGMTFVCKSM